MERASATPRQADLMIVAGRVSQKMAPVLRQIYDQMTEPKWVIAMGVCASSGGMFNNYAIVQGVDHVVPVDIYLPGCPPRPEMLLDAILKLHDKINNTKLGPQRQKQIAELEEAKRRQLPLLGQGRDVSSEHPEQRAEQAADQLPAHTEEERREQPIVRKGMCSARRRPATPPATAGWSSGRARRCPRRARTAGARGAAEPGEYDEIADELERAYPDFGDAIDRVVVHRGELTFHVKREHLREVAKTMRDEPSLRFELCSGVSGVHYPKDEGAELHAVVHLLSITHNRRIRLEASCPDADPHVPSLVPVYPTADWHERETYDFFGIVFDGHPALTRIEMPDDWVGHPQRKDYPLGGVPVEYRGAEIPPPDEGGRTYEFDEVHRVRRLRRRRGGRGPGSSTRAAATGTRSARPPRTWATSGSSSTWARSTRPRTACSA